MPASLEIAGRNTPAAFTLEGELVLTDERGQSVRLDVALAQQDNQRLRLRAWKFGQAVFDLTIRPDGVWAYSGREEFDDRRLRDTVVVVRPWLKLFSAVPPGARVIDENDQHIALLSRIENADVRTIIDRPTLTVRSHAMLAGGQTRATITFDRYAPFGDVVWPRRVRVREGKRGIELSTRTLATTINVRAFDPPRRAQRVDERVGE